MEYENIDIDISYENCLKLVEAIGITQIRHSASKNLFNELINNVKKEEEFIEEFHKCIGKAIYNDFMLDAIYHGLEDDPNLSEEEKEELRKSKPVSAQKILFQLHNILEETESLNESK